jgi:hypothetical protein
MWRSETEVSITNKKFNVSLVEFKMNQLFDKIKTAREIIALNNTLDEHHRMKTMVKIIFFIGVEQK